MKIENDQIMLSSIRDKLLFHKERGEGHLFHYIKNRIKWYTYPFLKILPRFPLHVDIETSTGCNMSCPMCYRQTSKFVKNVKSQFMEKKVFKKIVDECAYNKVFSIRLSLRGEPFMHPDIFRFIEIAKQAGIKEVSALTNGLALTPEKFERLVQLKFDWLTISFDGLGSTYESIRKPAVFLDALGKIKSYHRIKKRTDSSKPVVRIQTIWPAIKENPEEFFRTFSPFVNSITSNPLIDFLREDKDVEYDEKFQCPYLYQRLVIAVDGRVLLCTFDDYADYIIGDVKENSIHDIWHGKKMENARGWFVNNSKRWWESAPCKYCCYPRVKEKRKSEKIEGRSVQVEKYTRRSDEISIEK